MNHIATALLFLGLLAIAAPCVAEYVITANVSTAIIGFSNLNPIGDFDGDGSLEVALGTPGSPPNVTIYDAASGQIEGTVVMPFGNNWVAAAANVDNDPLPEIVAFERAFPNVHNGYVVVDFVGTAAAPPNVAPQDARGGIRPNPFNPLALIDYSAPSKGKATLVIYDAAGRNVRSLVDGPIEAGMHSISWDGRDDASRQLSSGTYFYRFSLDGKTLDTGKAVVLK